MRSVIRKKSYNSVKVFWLDTDKLIINIKKSIKPLVKKFPEVMSVILFGSIPEGRGVPSSDADFLIIVDKSDERLLDRSMKFRDSFKNIGLSSDIFVYTKDEIEGGAIPVAKRAIKKGLVLFEKNHFL